MTQPLPERLFARLLRLLPQDFRAEYGADAVATFARRASEVRRRGRAQWLIWVLRELAGLARAAAQEHAAALRRTTPQTTHRGPGAMEHLLRESRHAARRLVRTPGFTLAAVVTLALAIAANTAIFTLVYRIV
ncbi:MAG TPA: hypothetical protein VKA84_11545, partial [Gemmatimonadaceae bacterium]|nr:hypothetical protein [Gemmatimonadaceae bacterium]